MDVGSGSSPFEDELSNFTARAFFFRGLPVASMEGLVQSFKFEDAERQRQIMLLVGVKAKGKGKKRKWWSTQTLWWQGKSIDRHSQEYQQLLDEAFEAMFSQNQQAAAALIATGDARLEHSIGKDDPHLTVLTKDEFTTRLMNIRMRLQQQAVVD